MEVHWVRCRVVVTDHEADRGVLVEVMHVPLRFIGIGRAAQV